MNKDIFYIRDLKLADMTDVAHLYSLFWNEKMNISKMREKFLAISQNPNYIFLCAEHHGKVIGVIQGVVCEELYWECRPFLVMENFVIDQAYRNKGLGKKLLNELEEVGREKNCTQIIFITETSREDTVRFYERIGFDSSSHQGFKKVLKSFNINRI